MLVQALAEYADAYLSDQLADESWEEKPVPYLVELDENGTFLNVTRRSMQVPKGKKLVDVPAPLPIPRSPVPRNAGLHPLLAADDIKYVLGPGAWTQEGQQQNHQERHEAFIELIERASAETNDPKLKACSLFYKRPDQVDAARQSVRDAKAGAIVALSVGGPVVNSAAVKNFWRTHYQSASSERVCGSGSGECLISGRYGPIAPTHEKIKGISNLGGQASGVSLMSFDKDSFRSYGWDQNANSPVAPDRAMAYVLALNDLLRRDRGHRRDVAGIGFIFWTRQQQEFDPMGAIDQAEPAQVDALLRFDPGADPDPNQFFMAGLSGNGGRLLIRYWVSESLTSVKHNLQQWFNGLRVADAFGNTVPPPKLWQLLNAIHREGEPPPDRVIALIRRAVEGPSQPLGYRMLSAALTRMRSAKANRNDSVRLGLIRLCLNDLIHVRNLGEQEMTETLDPEQNHPAYLCGRLLATYEGLQYSASPGEAKVNLTVADRYYGLASSYPALAFPKLEDLGQKHLRKLRRDKPGAMVAIERRIHELHIQLEQASGYRFPASLDLDGQGRFALGYHHERAHQMIQAQARKTENLRTI